MYKFSLQNVLDWRGDQQDEARLGLIHAKKALEKELSYLERLIKENVQLKERISVAKRLDVMRQDDLYRRVLNDKIIQQKLIVEQLENDVKRAEKGLLVAYQDKKVMEKLKENDKQKFYDEIEATEQKNLDEFATMTFGRAAY